MARPKPGRRYGYLSFEEALVLLPDSPVINGRWVIAGAVFTEIRPVRWAHVHVMGLVTTYGLELAGPGASAGGWGVRSFHPHQGWIYFETRAHRRRK